MEFYAHSIDGKPAPADERYRLEAHLIATAELAASFPAEFGFGEWGRTAGLWHNLEKYNI